MSQLCAKCRKTVLATLQAKAIGVCPACAWLCPMCHRLTAERYQGGVCALCEITAAKSVRARAMRNTNYRITQARKFIREKLKPLLTKSLQLGKARDKRYEKYERTPPVLTVESRDFASEPMADARAE